MFSPSKFRDLVSGRRRGIIAAAMRCLLRVAEVPFTWAVRRRNRAFDRSVKRIHRVSAPVICVGNITLGGTGKTPLVAWLAEWFHQRGMAVAIVSRGYGAQQDGENDEALELKQRLPAVPHIQNPNRVAAAQAAIDQHGARVIVLDDGFQHRRLARDLNIVLLDALEPYGFDHVFPRGTLREPLDGLTRADVIALSKADVLDAPSREAVRQRVQTIAPSAAWIEIVHRPAALLDSAGQRSGIESAHRQKVAAFCGIGNPAGFRHTLERCGLEVVAWREFPDHFDFGARDIRQLDRWAHNANCDLVICTNKDLVKLKRERLGDRPLRALAIEVEFLKGREELVARLERIAAQSK